MKPLRWLIPLVIVALAWPQRPVPGAGGGGPGSDVVRGAAALSTVNSVALVSAAGTLGQDASLTYDPATNILTVQTINGSPLAIQAGGVNTMGVTSGLVALPSTVILAFSANGILGDPDVALTMDAAGVLGVTDGQIGTGYRDLKLRGLQHVGVAVSELPTADSGNAGTLRRVTDALSPVLGVTAVGGGAVPALVWSTGSAWHVAAI
jgi:hypothetical protein